MTRQVYVQGLGSCVWPLSWRAEEEAGGCGRYPTGSLLGVHIRAVGCCTWIQDSRDTVLRSYRNIQAFFTARQ